MNAVDTNILIYACDRNGGERHDRARRLIADLREAVVLWQVACEFIAASRKLTAGGFTRDQAWNTLLDLIDAFGLALPTAGLLGRARELNESRSLSFWDALIVAASLEAGVKRLYTEDMHPQSIDSLAIVNPFV